MADYPVPIPFIDTLSRIEEVKKNNKNILKPNDYNAVINFLNVYKGNNATFESYRRELERLIQWSWLVLKKSILKLSREDVESYIQFCQKPPKEWIGKKNVPRYLDNEEERIPNPEWKPFVVKVNKSDFKQGKKPRVSSYQVSQSSLRALFAILGSFYDYLLLEEKIQRNPIALIRQKSRYLQKSQQEAQIIRLSDKQWQACLKAVEMMASHNPQLHERTLFIIKAMYLMYLRISEFVASERWVPQMNH